MANRSYQFIFFEEVPHDLECGLIPSKCRGRLPSRNKQEIIIVGIDYLKGLEEPTSYPCFPITLLPLSVHLDTGSESGGQDCQWVVSALPSRLYLSNRVVALGCRATLPRSFDPSLE